MADEFRRPELRGSRPYLPRGGFTRQAVNIARLEALTKVRPVRLAVRSRQKVVRKPSGLRIEQEETHTTERQTFSGAANNCLARKRVDRAEFAPDFTINRNGVCDENVFRSRSQAIR